MDGFVAIVPSTLIADIAMVCSCVEAAYSFGPGFAFEFISDYSVPRCGGPYEHLDDQRIEFRLIEFTATDGKKVNAAW
jgi:hypothetical protein